MNLEQEYIDMIGDTTQLVAKERSSHLSTVAVAYQQSGQLANEVEFWKWMGKNYPKDFGNAQLIQKTAINKERWLNTQVQGKGYKWDYMTLQRGKPSKIFSKFDAGDCPTQPGIDITEMNVLNRKVKATYQNKAYLSNNNPDLHNTPRDAIVVTNREKTSHVREQGYQVEEYLDGEEIQKIRDSRFQQASGGYANTTYTLRNVINKSAKAGVVSAMIGITTETITLYRAWKEGKLTDEQYIEEVIKAGCDAGVTGTATAALMVPVQVSIVASGTSTLIGIPIAIILESAVNNIVAPCFGRGKYRQILGKAKYYQMLDSVYDDFIVMAEKSANTYTTYIKQMQMRNQSYMKMKEVSGRLNGSLKDLYDSI